MTYEIENYGDQATTGVRKAGGGEPNFPPNAAMGRENLAWGTDLIDDPADAKPITDPKTGWSQGIGGSQAS